VILSAELEIGREQFKGYSFFKNSGCKKVKIAGAAF
jgi:hypothetical protein